MAFGKVKWFSDAKGYGFFQKSKDEEIFVHYTAIVQGGASSTDRRTLREGDPVEFDVYEGDKGLHALNVVRIL
jgi:CspA family cold shock protein